MIDHFIIYDPYTPNIFCCTYIGPIEIFMTAWNFYFGTILTSPMVCRRTYTTLMTKICHKNEWVERCVSGDKSMVTRAKWKE